MEVQKIVPQFFYDLIARVIPGGAIIFGIAIGLEKEVVDLTLAPVHGSIDLSGASLFFVLVIMLFIYAYLAGHVVSPLGDMLVKHLLGKIYHDQFHVLRCCLNPDKSKFPKKIREAIAKEAAIEPDEENSRVEYTAVLYIWSDWLRLKNPNAGARIVKLRAEYRMYLGLLAASFITAMLHLVFSTLGYVTVNAWLLIASLAALPPLANGCSRSYSSFQWSVINNYYALKYLSGPGEPEEP